MYLWMNVQADYVITMSRKVMKEWVCRDDVIQINFYRDVLCNEAKLRSMARDFSFKTDGVIKECIGALDGWLVRICCPSFDEVNNPGKYCSRKGFFALNVQAIVDKQKRVLWRFIGERGSSHDLPTFHESDLGEYLLSNLNWLKDKGFYIFGDSAYAMRVYLLTPYDNPAPGSPEDNFNYFLSSNRIYVECAFGEIDRRWGIFWRRLEGDLCHHKYVIDSAMRLHNFIVDNREKLKKEHS